MVSAYQKQHTLIVSSGPNTGQTYVLQDTVSTFGRSADNTIVLDSTRVSRLHAKITLSPGGGAMIEDMGSTNGTFVNGQQITMQVPLSPGDMIGIADYVNFQYVVEGKMDMGQDMPHAPAGSTQIMGNQGLGGSMSTPPPTIPVPSYSADIQPGAYMPMPPPDMPPSAATAGAGNEKKRPAILYVIIALLVVFVCLCVALAVYLWFAPESFWHALFDLVGIPWPSQLKTIGYW
ncbi:MAG: FHA domain-containing protein [Anaerolineae bacterium]|nr:FHA domain-containing protein [Anaerolineae bacterium]